MSEDLAHSQNLAKTYSRLVDCYGQPWKFEQGWGWATLLDVLCTRLNSILEETPEAKLEVQQVKEKYGTLRFYYGLHSVDDERGKEIQDAVDLAEKASEHICQRCGSPNAMQHDIDQLIATLCRACRATYPR